MKVGGGAMTKILSRNLALVACVSLWPASVWAGPSDAPENLLACKQGQESCDRSRLSLAELTEVARADHARDVADCRNDRAACDRSRLSPAETAALAVAEHDRNVSNCTDKIGACDPSRLTPVEARDVEAAARRRRMSNCKDGIGACDETGFTGTERADVAAVARERMVWDCQNGAAECDRSRLTRAEERDVQLADRRRNLSNCMQGWDDCDHSKLGQQEAIEVDLVVRARNMVDCRGGRDDCDYSILSRSETAALAAAERTRNYQACVNGRGYCDRSRLTPLELSAIPARPGRRGSGRQAAVIAPAAVLDPGRASIAKHLASATMDALVYHGPGKRAWEKKPRPEIREATDALVRIRTSTICGTDLHILKGDVPSVTDGRILGHEGVGVVEDVGAAVSGICQGRHGADLVHHVLRQVRLLQEGNVLALPRRRLDPRKHDRRDPGRVRPDPARRHQPASAPAGRRRAGDGDAE